MGPFVGQVMIMNRFGKVTVISLKKGKGFRKWAHIPTHFFFSGSIPPSDPT